MMKLGELRFEPRRFVVGIEWDHEPDEHGHLWKRMDFCIFPLVVWRMWFKMTVPGAGLARRALGFEVAPTVWTGRCMCGWETDGVKASSDEVVEAYDAHLLTSGAPYHGWTGPLCDGYPGPASSWMREFGAMVERTRGGPSDA
jgi:hypothetical protein